VYKLNPVDLQLETAWFQPLNLLSEELVSNFAAFKLNLYRYSEVCAVLSRAVGLCRLNQVDP
jgi:hypothetical protein